MQYLFSHRYNRLLIILAFFCLVLLGNPQLARADWRQDIGVFRIGIVAGDDVAGTLARVEPFRLAIAEALEIDVELFPASNSRTLIDAIAAERIEYALLSSSGYALASVRCDCVEPLVIPRSTDSTDGYHLVGIIRQGADFDPAKLSTQSLAMISRDSITGQAFVKHLLSNKFPTIDFSNLAFGSKETSEATQSAFARGEFDILFGWSSLTGDPARGYSRGSLTQLVQRSVANTSAYRIGWQSPQIPHRSHVIRKKLPGEAKTRLRETLVNLFNRDPVAYDSIEPVYGGGFTAARNERFRELVKFLKAFNTVTNVELDQPTGSVSSQD